MKVAIIIPSRIGSTRLPRKALLDINGKTLIERCYTSAMNAKIGDVFVATDCNEIASVIQNLGGKTFITPPELPSGTDRIFHAYQQIGEYYDYIVNLQGDVPNIHPQILQSVIDVLHQTGCDISTATMKTTTENAQRASCVKAVLSPYGNFFKAIYFSRSPVPYGVSQSHTFFEHIGIYAYTPKSLKKFTCLPESTLEVTEKLEQLRALENEMSICACVVDSSLKPINIDTEEDIVNARKLLKNEVFASTTKYQNLANSLKKNLARRKV